MASAACVTKCLAILSEAKPEREISANTVAVYVMALDDVADSDLERAVARALKMCRFFPSPAELREFAGANRSDPAPVEAILERIRGLFSYLPTSGDQPPSVATVSRALGNAIGQAYGAVGGGERLFAGNDTTRSIARREFGAELDTAIRDLGASAVLSPVTQPVAALPSPSTVIYHDRPQHAAGPRRLNAATALSHLENVP